MPEPTGTDLERYAHIINHAIELNEAGDTAQAAQLMSGLVVEFGDAASAHGYLGWFLLQLGQHEEALEQSRRAIAIAPRSEKASLVHFWVLWQTGKHIEALDEMKRLLTIRPSETYSEMIEKWKPHLEIDDEVSD